MTAPRMLIKPPPETHGEDAREYYSICAVPALSPAKNPYPPSFLPLHPIAPRPENIRTDPDAHVGIHSG
jgi:hypothetical protein